MFYRQNSKKKSDEFVHQLRHCALDYFPFLPSSIKDPWLLGSLALSIGDIKSYPMFSSMKELDAGFRVDAEEEEGAHLGDELVGIRRVAGAPDEVVANLVFVIKARFEGEIGPVRFRPGPEPLE